MALTFDKSLLTIRGVTGIALLVVPGRDTSGRPWGGTWEVQRAPDSAGSPDTGNAETVAQSLPPLPPAGGVFLDPRSLGSGRWHYRWRQTGPNVNPGAYSAWLSATPLTIPKDVAQAALNNTTVYPLVRGDKMSDGKYALLASDPLGATADVSVKLVPAVGVFEGGVVHKLYRHREEIVVNGADADGETDVSFAQTYQNAPMILFKGGQYVSFSNTLGTSVKQRLRVQAVNVTATGFRSRAQITNPGATTAQTDDFANGNLLDAQGETAEVNLDPGAANDDTYNVHYYVKVTADQDLAEPGSEVQANLVVAIDTNDGTGTGWVERATFAYSAIANDADPSVVNEWTEEVKAIVVTGLGINDDIRLRAKSFSVNTIGGSSGTGTFEVRGGDASGSNPGSYNGVTYTTASDTTESAIPSAGDQVAWVAQEVT